MQIAPDFSRRLDVACARWGLHNATLIADTPSSLVFKTFNADGDASAVKLLKPYGADELIGVSVLRWYRGEGAVRIADVSGHDILMEWLEGKTLGDLVRRDEDERATAILIDVIKKLHQPRGRTPTGLISMEDQCKPVLAGDFSFWPHPSRRLGARVQDMARKLLDTQAALIPLHGDLHHDNVVNSSRGWQVIDAKGLFGDPAYEFSNIFRNPKGAEHLCRDPSRSIRLALEFGRRFGIEPSRLIEWAMVHSGLSTFWNRSASNAILEDLGMLEILELVLPEL